MTWTIRTHEELVTLCVTEPEPTANAVFALQSEFLARGERIAELERQVHQTSQNSHQPPSADDPYQPPTPKSLRTKTGRPSGGQVGHPGSRLELQDDPDTVVTHRPPRCHRCGNAFPETGDSSEYDRRQVFDLQIALTVTEHRALTVTCAQCQAETTAAFPETVSATTQYGPDVLTFLNYGNIYQLLPADRLCEMFEDLTGHSISQGTLYRTVDRLAERLQPFEEALKQEWLQAPVVHFDESGAKVGKTLHWLHVASTNQSTYYRIHPKHSHQAMDDMGILPTYSGVAVHDGLATYHRYQRATHSLCNQHHERELQGIVDHDHQTWAAEMITHLHTIKAAKEAAVAAGRDALSQAQVEQFTTRYRALVVEGLTQNPRREQPTEVPKNPRVKQTKARNLVQRLDRYQSDVLRFMTDFRVPYTNNRAEQDIRMIKVRQKISGAFRSPEGAAGFATIRGYISTLKKRGLPVWKYMKAAYEGKPFLPATPANPP